jgi:uncharacterized membrane protein YkvA (DUF1232 family)
MNNRKIVQKGGVMSDLVKQVKLVARLMGDRRVSGMLKLLPIASIAYLILPIDFIPGGLVTVVGALDDAAVLWIGSTFFIELCPPDVVREHRQALDMESSGSADAGEIIDAESRDLNS